jgi:hypothetical protein
VRLDVLERHGITDVASLMFRDGHGCWGFLDLWRRDRGFEVHECEQLGAVATRPRPGSTWGRRSP